MTPLVILFTQSDNRIMGFYEVALVKSARSMSELLTYRHDDDLQKGRVVRLKVRGKAELGIIIREVSKPNFATKPIDSPLDLVVNLGLLDVAGWISEYYRAPIGSCVRLLVPAGLDVKRRKTHEQPRSPKKIITAKDNLTKSQKAAIHKINHSNATTLLYGVTGSGKTRVYIEAAQAIINDGKSVIVLVPEISLTTQLVEQFEQHFKNVIVTHSHMTESQRHHIWQSTYNSNEPMVVIGPRSALFSPLSNLGLVIIDECHDDAYKQTNTPRYNSLKVARKLCDLNDAKLLMGSATPAVVDFYLANERDAVVKLPNPIKSTSGRTVSLIDMRTEKSNTLLSREALDHVQLALSKKQQVLVYHNRRGTSPLVICSKCSWTVSCPSCHIPMVLHHDEARLRCHSCGLTQKLATSCPDCGNTDIVHRGFGTKKIEKELSELFPKVKIARFDTDVKRADSLASRYRDVHSGRIDVLVGTQMLAKGLDLPNLSTGIVVSADTGLSIPDFRTNEKVFQLLHQVIGRIGRHSAESYVGIQSYSPDNSTIQLAIRQDYNGFYDKTLKERLASFYPPFKHLLLLTCSYATREKAYEVANQALRTINNEVEAVEIIGPAPSFYERYGNRYRWQLLIKSSSRKILLDIAEDYSCSPRWSVDIDPVSLL